MLDFLWLKMSCPKPDTRICDHDRHANIKPKPDINRNQLNFFQNFSKSFPLSFHYFSLLKWYNFHRHKNLTFHKNRYLITFKYKLVLSSEALLLQNTKTFSSDSLSLKHNKLQKLLSLKNSFSFHHKLLFMKAFNFS